MERGRIPINGLLKAAEGAAVAGMVRQRWRCGSSVSLCVTPCAMLFKQEHCLRYMLGFSKENHCEYRQEAH